MKKLFAFLALAGIFGCATSTKTTSGVKPLYEVLTTQSTGGASIRFFEILTESKEIAMLQGDENLADKIRPDDLSQSNFIILNMGEKPSGGYTISVDNVRETQDKVFVTVKENTPAAGVMTTTAISYPYTVVKINSKKEIVIE